MSKKFISLLILLAMTLSITVGNCSCSRENDFSVKNRELADEETLHFGNYEYMKYSDGTAVITSYTGDAASLTIPASFDGADIVAIGSAAFAENTSLVSLTLPSTLEMIGDFAFYLCSSLADVKFGNKLWSIGVSAFESTPWLASETDEYVVVGDNVLLKYQGSAHAVTVPKGIKHLADAFTMNSELISVELPDTLLTIGVAAFSFCTELRHVCFGENLILIGDGAFEGCEALPAINIPDSVVSIGINAFRDCFYLTDIQRGSSLREIGEYAFGGDVRIKIVSLPTSIELIDDNAFFDCFSLMYVFYEGTEDQFEDIQIYSSNYMLTSAYRICNYRR